MTLMPLDTLGVTSTDGVANVLGTLLAVSTTPATLLLEELARTQIRIEVLGRADRELTAAEQYRLDAGPITAGHYRTGLLRTASGLVAAETSLVIVPERIPPRARAALAGASIPVGKILAPLGMQRVDRRALCRHGCLDAGGGDVAVSPPLYSRQRGQGRHRHRADHRGLLPADRRLTGHDQPPGFAGYCG